LTETWRALLLASALALPAAASAVTLTDVRIGVHPEYTRVVLETDAKAPYIVDAGEREIVVHVDAAAAAEAVTAKSPHLIWAKVEPTQIGADVRLQLKQPSDVKAMVLTGPHRIVLDLYPRKGVPAPLPAPELLIEEEPEEADLAPPPSEVEAEAEPEAEDAEAAADVAAEGAPGAEPAEGEPEAEPEAAPDAEAPEALAGDAEAAGEPAAGEEAETAPEAPASDALAAAPDAATPEPPARAAPTTPLAPAPSGSGSLLGSPYLLGAAAVALVVVFLFLRRLGRGGKPAREREDMGLPPLDEAPAHGATAAAPAAAGGGDGSLFDVEAEAILPPPKDDDSLPQLRSAAPEPVDETERRIVALERRIEELVDARERLERQVSAQTEELRVQRAAIARTQRVLRTVAPRSEDDPSGTSGEPR
jgi:hypothetical protein